MAKKAAPATKTTPVKKAAPAKKAVPAKAAAAKKAAPAKRVRPAEVAAPAWPEPEVLGDAEERDPDEPVVSLPPAPPGLLDELTTPSSDGRVPLPLRLLRGDWRSPLTTAAAALAATFVLAMIATASLLVLTPPDGDGPFLEGTGAGRFLRYVCSAVGLTFGSSLSISQEYRRPDGAPEGFGSPDGPLYTIAFAPLTVTLLALLALWLVARRMDTADRLATAVLTAVPFGVGVAAVTAFGTWRAGEEDGDSFFGITYVFRTSPWKALFWAFLAAFAVVWLATGRTSVPERFRDWAVAARSAVVGVVTGLALSFALLVSLGYVYADGIDATTSEVTRAVPVSVSYAPNLAPGVFGWVTGGTLHRPPGLRPLFSFEGDDLSPWLYLGVLIPVVAVAVAVLHLRRRVPAADLARIAGRMAVPATVLWAVLAVLGNARFGTGFGFGLAGGTVAGPSLWNALLVALWFGPVAWLAGWLVAQRSFDPRLLDP